jgi:hypothetical protein
MSSTVPNSTRRFATTVAALALVFLTECATESEDPGNAGSGCLREYIITYSAVATGDGQFDFVSYDNGFGRRIDVVIPGKTWTTQIRMCESETLAMEAGGAVSAGNLMIAISGDDGTGNQVTLSDEVTGDGTVTSYTLMIAPQTLP